MLIPLNTDAPLYHYPWGTIGLIAANLGCFVLTGFGLDNSRLDAWALQHGEGLNPVQWLSSAFAHAGFLHLLGNMFFLWGFGLVVEGKMGWRRFVPMYLLLVCVCGAAEDVLTLHRTPQYVLGELGVSSTDEILQKLQAQDPSLLEKLQRMGISEGFLEDLQRDPALMAAFAVRLPSLGQGQSVGASGVIFSLLGISLLWAPKNELHLVGLLGPRAFSFDVSIMAFSGWKIAWEVSGWLLSPGMQTPGLNLTGLVPGLVVGSVMLRRGWVNCENWDLFAVMSGRYGRFADPNWHVGTHAAGITQTYGELPLPQRSDTDSEADAVQGRGRSSRRKQVPDAVNALIDKGDCLSAADELFQLRLQQTDLCPGEERTKRLALGLIQAEAWDQAEIWLQEYIERFSEDNRWARIRLAELLLLQSRPRAALRQLKGLQTEGLHPQLLATARKVLHAAKELMQQGVEDAAPDWT
ncbi:MAG: rhomboid family intramembrane serine protease [Planctomycetota bacterium]